MSVVTGDVKLDGRALANQRVLLISGDMTRLLGSTTTGEDGRFAVDVPNGSGQNRIVLLVKLQGPVVALAHRVVDPAQDGEGPHEFLIETDRGDLHSVSGQVVTTSGWPPYLTIFVNPVHVEGIPAELEAFFDRREAGVVESTFFKRRVDGQEFELKLQAGTYLIGGSHLNYQRPNLASPDFENYVVSRVEADGESEPLPGNPSSGYRLEVTRDRRITMTIEVVPDVALSPPGP
jgi:hypothetical protein